ncbi:MAG: hypothetical protein ACFFEM_17015, partial [Candidatus Thorarchaeota archaeon]
VQVLADELERTRTQMAVPEEPELESRYGLGPSASKVYSIARGLSIGGYGEGVYQKFIEDAGGSSDRADLLRMVLYAGYKFTDSIVFNSEIEFEHASTGATVSSGGGSVSVEFAALDFSIREWANLRAGLLLLPMGFINEIHEPPFYYGVHRPEVERQIIPATWRENGAGIFGSLFGGEIEYTAYVVNGLDAEGFSPSGLRGGRQKGNRALAEHLAFVGEVNWSPLPGFLLGGSVYSGKSGQNQVAGGVPIPDTPTTIWEVHSQLRRRGLHLRGLFAMAHIGDAERLTSALRAASVDGEPILGPTQTIASEMQGGYVEIGYNVLPLLFPGTEKLLEPYFRFESYDTQHQVPSGFLRDRSKEIRSYTYGLQFKPIPNVVIKMDARERESEAGDVADEFNVGLGFAF